LVRGLFGVVLEKPGLSEGLFALIPMAAGSRKKRLGDLAAGTVVLHERVPGRLDTPVEMPPALASWASTLDLTGVDDALALRMRQFLGRAGAFTPDARATLERQIAADVTTRVGPPPPYTPGWAVIAAVLAERRRRAFASSQPWPQPAAWPGHAPAVAAAAPVTPPELPPSPTGFAPPG
jgi:hypothetical protein